MDEEEEEGVLVMDDADPAVGGMAGEGVARAGGGVARKQVGGEQDQAHIWHSGQLTIKMLYCQETGSIGAGGGRQGGRGGLSAEAGGRPSQRPGPEPPSPLHPPPRLLPFLSPAATA